MARKFKLVSKEEFDKYLSSYPRQLDVDVTGVCEPPMKTYNDFFGGKVWPDSIVAKESMTEVYPTAEEGGRHPYLWAPNALYIPEDYPPQATGVLE